MRTSLEPYAAKRAFDRTPEPAARHASGRTGSLLFVVQQHAARRLHYDFRLEVDGVLKSWAIPKGPSLDPGVKRLAAPTEDHPFDYGSFEGVIPRGQYGAGEVIVWDCGVFVPERDGELLHDRAEADRYAKASLEKGKLSFLLRGVKLKGSFAIVRTSRDKQWLLIKHKDAFVGEAEVDERGRSVLSSLRLDDMTTAQAPARIDSAHLIPHGPRRRMPSSIAPMLAERGTLPKAAHEFLYEPKLDGYRTLAFVRDREVRLQSRRGLDLSVAFPEIVAELAAQQVGQMILDCELVALDTDGKPSFNALQNRAGLKTPAEVAAGQRAAPALLYCFDLLHFEGVDLTGAEYVDRRRYLSQCLLPSTRVQLVYASADADALVAAAVDAGFEGVMAKRKGSRYVPGVRSRDWIKVKTSDGADLVVAGYTEGIGARKDLGALVLGYWDGKELKHAGSVGSGFDTRTLERVRTQLEKLKTDRTAFATRPSVGRPVTWVRPEVVVEVSHAGWTPDGKLRAPIFKRVRDDLDPASVQRRETNLRFEGTKAPPPTARASRSAKSSTDASDVLEQLARAKDTARLVIEGAEIKLTHLGREYWPAERSLKQPAITKRDLLRYLIEVAPYMLPHLRNRPLTMIRMPEGILGERFFQKHWDKTTPDFVESIELYSETKGLAHHYLLCNNLPTLVWLGQMGTLEFHIWHSRAELGEDAATRSEDYASSSTSIDESILNYPDYIVFDIDPYIYSGKEAKGAEPELNDRAFRKGVEVARWLHEVLKDMKLPPIIKTSGKTGLHLFVPIDRTITFDMAREFAERIGRHLMREHPADITMEWAVKKRTGKIFIDFNMNVRGKTLNVAYSPRGVRGAPVSMPVTWRELPRVHPMDYRITNAAAHVKKRGDVWQDIPKANLARALAL
jgi:bifunctional non-homologous end joining protein LigD